MAQTPSRTTTAEYQAVIYLCGTEGKALDDAERRCRDYAARFGWPVLDSIRRHGSHASATFLVSRARALGAQIIITDTLDMLAPDQAARDEVLAAIERGQCILHPVAPPRRPDVASSARPGGDRHD
jgi:DNA polymerase III alpha subunit